MAKARKRSARAIEKEQDELDARLRSYGEDEARRRWREAEESGAWYGRNRHHVLAHFEKMAADAKPDRVRWMREHLGDRETQFREGLANQIAYYLRRGLPVKYQASPEQMEEIRLHEAFMDRPITPEFNAMKFEDFKKTQVKRSR